MYWFGENNDKDFNWQSDSAWEPLKKKRVKLAETKISDILDLLDSFSFESFSDAIPELIRESGFSVEETQKTLALLPQILKKENLEKRLKAEFGNLNVLDRFVKLPHGAFKTRAVPHGILLHVTAGNVFLSSIDSLIMGFITKNLSVLKTSGQNKFFPLYFAQKLGSFDRNNILADKFAVVHWKGGDLAAESFIKRKVDTIIAWGGEEMISSYRKDLPPQVKFLDFGPRISFQVVSREGIRHKSLKKVAVSIVADITPWDQGACASPQNLYLQEGIDKKELLKEIDLAFRQALPRGPISEDEATEILKERYRGLYSELMEGGSHLQGSEHLLHLEINPVLRPSPLNRSLIIKRFSSPNELQSILQPFSYYLQSCSYLLSEDEKDEFLRALCLTGIKRFAPLGTVTWGMEGAPHDGRFVLRELVSFIGDELRTVDLEADLQSLNDSQSGKAHFEGSSHPLGYIFSSGGTTGSPKFVNFSYEEFDYMSDLLAQSFRAQGITSGMIVANLFVAGNLWSSFLCVDKALEKIGAIQLPIGGMCSPDNVLTYLKKFRPQVIMGIPSMLIINAEQGRAKGESLEVPMVFYAGEALSETRRKYLQETWGTRYFGSAGYASVDAGVIGYQCLECGPGEHHVFSDLIDLKIVEGEGVVTSLARDSMPVKNYRTGDRIEWVNDCSCGRPDKRFRLLGRIDNVILIWSCRLNASDIEASMNDHGIMSFQIKIQEEEAREKISLTFEKGGKEINQDELLLDLYQRSRDVRDTIEFSVFRQDFKLIMGEVPRNSRTGKISHIVDLRR